MAQVGPNDTSINLIIPKEGKQALELMVEREGLKSVSDLIRSLLTNYCRGGGLDVDFRVGSWGGNRRKDWELLKSQQADPGRRAIGVEITDNKLRVTLADGSEIATPLIWYPFLENATPAQRAKVTLMGNTLFWDDLDDGLSIDGMLKGPNDVIKAAIQRKVNPR